MGVATHVEGATLITQVRARCPQEGVAGQWVGPCVGLQLGDN